MRLATALAVLAASSVSAIAAPAGLPTHRFSTTWDALPTGAFVPRADPLPVKVLSAHAATVPSGDIQAAFASAADDTARRDLAIDAMASTWEPAQRTALEDLRAAQRLYATASRGDEAARGERFVAMVRQVVDGTGRSAAKDRVGDAQLDDAYALTIRDAPDDALTQIETSERAWTAYRDAFARFATAMDRSDLTPVVDDELALQRVGQLERETNGSETNGSAGSR